MAFRNRLVKGSGGPRRLHKGGRGFRLRKGATKAGAVGGYSRLRPTELNLQADEAEEY